jgi:hypothetical protein
LIGIVAAARSRRDFDNIGDATDDLRQILDVSFQKVEVKVIRSVAHFTAPSRCHLTLGRRQPTPSFRQL